MNKKGLFLIILLFFLIFLLNVSCIKAVASSNDLTPIGTFVIQVPVNKTTKVYIEPKLKQFVESNGIEVYEEEDGWGIFATKKYYYISNKFVDKIVASRQLYNDIDSLIFIVNELEQKANNYKKLKLNDNPKNLVLGYIRTINVDYDDSQLEWSTMAGTCDENFINEVDSENKFGLKIKEYFAQFIDYKYFNTKIHGEVDEKYRKNKSEVVYLEDAANYSPKMKVDLIHFFGCIDGIYINTGMNPFAVIGNNMQRDVVSWNGDLQQAAFDLKSNGNIDLKKYDMNSIFYMINSRCPLEDIIGDIDAMNITKTYIDMENTSIANALSAYYLLIEKKPSTRFKLFIKTVLLEEEHPSSNDEKDRLKKEIYSEFNIEEKNGKLQNHRYYLDPKGFLGFSIMRDGGWIANIGGDIPSEDIRGFVVKSFYEYIIKNAGV